MDCQHQQVAATNIAAPPVSIHVMVVDDDVTSLAVVSGLLRTLNYEVTSFNDPFRALYTLRAGKQSFDLIMIDLYMPKMDGFEMTKRVIDEFKLPVIMISTDDRESVIFRAIQEGVVLYLLKPFTLNDLRNIWQFVISTNLRSKPNPNLFIDETRSHEAEFPVLEAYSREANSVSSSNEVRREKKKKDSKENGESQEKANDRRELTTATKKAKVVWTDFLQYRFLQAVHYIGLDRAVPKKILQVMNVPGLTRENVASHLQKYRIFLRKVAERCMITSDKTTEEILWSKFLSRHASLILQKIQREGTFQSIEAARNSHLSFAQSPGSFETKQEIKMEKRKYYQTVPSYQKSSNDNNSGHQPTKGWSSFLRNLPPSSQGHTARFIGGAAAFKTNQNKAQVCNFDAPETHPRNSEEAQFQNLAFFEDSYLRSSFPGSHNYAGFSVGAGRELSLAQKGYSNGCENGFDGNYMGFEAIQRDEYRQYGIGVGGDNSYNWSLMCNNGVNYGGNSQTVSHSSHSLDNKDGAQEDSYCFASLLPLESFVHNPTPNQEQGSESHQLYNIYAADEETPTTDPFSIDDQVLDEFLASLLRNDTSAEG